MVFVPLVIYFYHKTRGKVQCYLFKKKLESFIICVNFMIKKEKIMDELNLVYKRFIIKMIWGCADFHE